MKFVRMKIGHICKYTGYRPDEMLDLLMESLGLGKGTVPEKPDLVAQFFVKFRRMSTTRLTKAHVNAMSDRLDEMREFINSHKPPELWINWPERVERAKKLLATAEEKDRTQEAGNGLWRETAEAAMTSDLPAQ